jgi:Cu/Ag efflux protein CusF
MTNIKALLTAATIVSAFSFTAQAQEFTRGTVKEIKADQEKVTIIHEELANLDMPAMTMVFNVADPAMLDEMSEGSDILFVADRVRGKLTIVEIQ